MIQCPLPKLNFAPTQCHRSRRENRRAVVEQPVTTNTLSKALTAAVKQSISHCFKTEFSNRSIVPRFGCSNGNWERRRLLQGFHARAAGGICRGLRPTWSHGSANLDPTREVRSGSWLCQNGSLPYYCDAIPTPSPAPLWRLIPTWR